MKRLMTILLACAILLSLYVIPVSSASPGTLTRLISPDTADHGGNVTVTITPDAAFPGTFWGVIERVPSGAEIGETTCVYCEALVDGQYKFIQLNKTSFSYQLAVPGTAGTYRISGTFLDENKESGIVVGETDFVVTGGGEIASIVVSPPACKIEVGETIELSATGYDSGSALVPLSNDSWKSNNTNVATVTGSAGSGTVTGAGQGTATISVTQEGVTGTSDLSVYANIIDAYRDTVSGLIEDENLVNAIDDWITDALSSTDLVKVIDAWIAS